MVETKRQEKSTMRCLVYAGIIVAMLFVPVKKLDAAKLIPVEAVAVAVAVSDAKKLPLDSL